MVFEKLYYIKRNADIHNHPVLYYKLRRDQLKGYSRNLDVFMEAMVASC